MTSVTSQRTDALGGPSAAGPGSPGGTPPRVFFLGVVVGAIVMWVLAATLDVGLPARNEVRVLEGTLTAVNHDGSAIGFDGPDARNEGFVVAGALWSGPDDVWDDSMPTCASRRSVGQQITLGVIDAPPTEPADIGRPVVVWLICHGDG